MTLGRFALLLALTAQPVALHAQASPRDSLDGFVRAQMARRHIRGLSLAVIQDGRIVVARGYGVTDDSTATPVTPTTLFQAGSISKPVAALGALHLVEAGRLTLDGDVNGLLTTWHVPDNRFTATEKVTLRRILSHNAGFTVHGFPGYDVNDPRPSLVQVLDGVAPANTPAIRVDTTPGAIWRYSGGGFTVMQQMMIDVTGMPFPRYMQRTVLDPIGMTNSSYEQPQPAARAARTATGYYPDGSPVRGRWHVYPEMAAAGLWTTASDLARFAIEIQRTLAGRGHGVISPAMARQYVTVQKDPSGLGIIVNDSGAAQTFGHGGRDEGFDAQLIAFVHSGQGAAIMIDANDDSRFMGRLLDFIGRAWGWPNSQAAAPAATRGEQVGIARLTRCAGYYEAAENQMVTLAPNADGTGLETIVSGFPDESFLALDTLTFGSAERDLRLGCRADGMRYRLGDPRERGLPRVAPLPSTVTPAADPDPLLTARITAALQAMRAGGAALADAPDITPGAKRDFAGGAGQALEGMGPLTYVGVEDVTGRGIHRHGGEVARVRFYAFTIGAVRRYVLVHLTAGDVVTDYDVVAL